MILVNYQLPVKKVTYKVKHSNKGKNMGHSTVPTFFCVGTTPTYRFNH